MKCPDCEGDRFENGLFSVGDIFKGDPIVIRNVAGSKCVQCGYLLIPATVAKEISKVLAEGSSNVAYAREYDLARAEVAAAIQQLPSEQRTPGVQTISLPTATTPSPPRHTAGTANLAA